MGKHTVSGTNGWERALQRKRESIAKSKAAYVARASSWQPAALAAKQTLYMKVAAAAQPALPAKSALPELPELPKECDNCKKLRQKLAYVEKKYAALQIEMKRNLMFRAECNDSNAKRFVVERYCEEMNWKFKPCPKLTDHEAERISQLFKLNDVEIPTRIRR